MSANLKKTKTEKEKTAGSEGEEGGGAHLRYTQKPNKAGRTAPTLRSLLARPQSELVHPKPTSECQDGEQGIQSLQRLRSQQRPSTFPTQRRKSVLCDAVQAEDINSS